MKGFLIPCVGVYIEIEARKAYNGCGISIHSYRSREKNGPGLEQRTADQSFEYISEIEISWATDRHSGQLLPLEVLNHLYRQDG